MQMKKEMPKTSSRVILIKTMFITAADLYEKRHTYPKIIRRVVEVYVLH